MQGESTASLWDAESGRAILAAAMPLKRFYALSALVRFGDRNMRAERRAEDRKAVGHLVCAPPRHVHLLAMMAEFGVKPELTSPEVLMRAFLAAMFYKSKTENLLPLPGKKREHDDPYQWAYMLSDGKVLRHILTSGGFDPHLMSSAKGQVLKKIALKMTVILIVCFFNCWLPYYVSIFVNTLMMLNVVSSSCELQQAVETWISITKALAYSHCCLNPILYAFLGQFHRTRVRDFRLQMQHHLRQQISFFQKITAKLEDALQKYDNDQ
ncbi:hypothetical protein GOODEAATRI_018361 [Goodea atripinnis]|uniref:G-protein coupled receptors family 1 profile domain-containing protein n=1 Tax=Goodea atripinnis TaxID=208336 RepID=A0ABV0P5W2_9TELE